MKVCFIAEGCYPYVVGGVSSWIHSMINTFPDVEFYLIAVLANRNQRGKFKYQLPDNLTRVYEVYLQDVDWSKDRQDMDSDELAWIHLSKTSQNALRSLVLNETVDWNGIFDLFRSRDVSINKLLMSPPFLEVVTELYKKNFSGVTFADFLWTMRSIYLPLFLALEFDPPEADVYHCVATGYSGVIGSMAKAIHPKSKLMISEHGIYTREREEEIIKAKWIQGLYKDIWIQQFRKLSECAYTYADKVTSLYAHAQELQWELGCPKEKTIVTPNGINTARFATAPLKDPEDDFINVGAIVRLTPIKDIKTMISAFNFAQRENPKLKLWIMGPDDEDPAYAQECYELVQTLGARNIVFTGRINTLDYIGKMDMTILTSISEGQPLTILEGFAVKKPCLATNVGNCKGLIYGEADDFGPAGIVVPVMNIVAISEALQQMADKDLLAQMGEAGYKRLMSKYKIEDMRKTYTEIYDSFRPKG